MMMKCPECGLDTEVNRGGHVPNAQGALELIGDFECSNRHTWDFNFNLKKPLPAFVTHLS